MMAGPQPAKVAPLGRGAQPAQTEPMSEKARGRPARWHMGPPLEGSPQRIRTLQQGNARDLSSVGNLALGNGVMHIQRIGRKLLRNSATNNSGCSNAAK
jgi:hypothetical protein